MLRVLRSAGIAFFLLVACALSTCSAAAVDELTDAEYHLPNIYFQFSEKLLDAVLGSSTRTYEPFTERIQGSLYRGRSITDADLIIQTQPADDAVTLNLIWLATVNSTSRTTQQRTTVSSVSTTRIAASKRATYESEAWQLQPSQANANSRSRITGVKSRRIVGRRIARRRAYQQRGSVDYSVARRAELRTRSNFDSRTQAMFASWERDFDHNVRQPLTERGLLPQLVAKRSTDDRVELAFFQNSPPQLEAVTYISTRPSKFDAGDLVLNLHQTAINNFADSILAGQLYSENQLAAQLEKNLAWKLAGFEPADKEKLWTIDFAEKQPLRFEFYNNTVKVTIDTRGFTVGDQQIPGARLRIAYELSIVEGKLLGSRLGRIDITPLSAAQEGEKVGVRFQVFRSMLRRRFEHVFPSEFTLTEFPTPVTWPPLAALHFATAITHDEWLSLSCELPGNAATSDSKLVSDKVVVD